MKYQRLILALVLLVLTGGMAYGENAITGLTLHGVVQKITPESGDDSVTVRDDSVWIVIDDVTRISFIAGDHGGVRLQGGINKTIEFAYDSIFVDADTNTATPIILFGGYGGAIRWNRATDKMQFSNDLSAWSDIGTSAGISESDYNNLIKNGAELKAKIDSTVVKIPTATLADSANGGAIRSETSKEADSTDGGATQAESAQGLVGKSVNSTDPADGEVLTYYTTGDTLGWTTGGSLTEEEVEDFVGGMLGGTETNISVTYEDGTNDIDFVVDSEPWDSVTAWANLVNDDRDSVLAFSPIVSEAKDSLTSWADEVNTNTDSVASWANEVNAATDSLSSWADEVNTNTDHAADNSQAHTDYMLNTGDIATGVYDFGGATSLEIPAVADPATTLEGHIAWDANDDAIEVYMGDESESALIPAYQKIDALIFAPDGVADVITLLKVDALLYPFGIEIDQLSFTLPADAAYDIGFHEWTGADPPVFSAQIDSLVTTSSDAYIEDGTPTDGAIAADATIRANIRSTDVDWVHIQIIFHVNDGN